MSDRPTDENTESEPLRVQRVYLHDDGSISYTLGDERVRNKQLAELDGEVRDQVQATLEERRARDEAKAAEAEHQAWYEEYQRRALARRVRNAGGRRRR